MTRYSVHLLVVFAAGMALGGFYFAILWQTVRRLPTAAHPARLLLTSLTIRMGIVLPSFYLLMAGQWKRIVVALVGFVVMREILTRFWGKEKPGALRKGTVNGYYGPE